MRPGSGPHLRQPIGITEQPVECVRPHGRVLARDEQPRLAVNDRLVEPAGGARDDGHPGRSGLERDEPKGLGLRRHDHDRRSSHPAGELGPRQRAVERGRTENAELGRQLVQAPRVVSTVRRGRTDDPQARATPSRDRGDRLNCDVEPLQRV